MFREQVGGKIKSFYLLLYPQEDTYIVHHRCQATIFHPNPSDQLPVDTCGCMTPWLLMEVFMK